MNLCPVQRHHHLIAGCQSRRDLGELPVLETGGHVHRHQGLCAHDENLPVLDEGELVGIITDTDFVAVAINLLELLEETEPVAEDDYDVGVA